MTNAQKVIKLCAQAFAIFLIFTIISAVLTGFYGIGMAINGKNKENDSKDLEIISCENYNEALNEVIINTMYSDLEIKKSDTFKIESNNAVKCKANNGTIKIEDKNKWKKNKLIVYLPSIPVIVWAYGVPSFVNTLTVAPGTTSPVNNVVL